MRLGFGFRRHALPCGGGLTLVIVSVQIWTQGLRDKDRLGGQPCIYNQTVLLC